MPNPNLHDMPRVHEISPSSVIPSDSAQIPGNTPPDDKQPLDPEPIFREAISNIDTQPLPKIKSQEKINWRVVILAILLYVSFLGGSLLAALTYPTVTVAIAPVEKSLTLTTTLSVNLRHLAPITLTRSLRTFTTGRGHQNAKAASGTLTFYNGEFTAQTIAAGAVFTGKDGVKVAIDQAVTIPSANPPYFGQVSVKARAIVAGAAGNTGIGDINAACCFPSVVVKNTTPFTGGLDTRDYQAVAKADLDTLNLQLKRTLSLGMQQAFALHPGEILQFTACVFKASSSHQVGEEAATVEVKAANTCQGVAYNEDELLEKATATFRAMTGPGPRFALAGNIQVRVIGLVPFVVRCKGIWAYIITESYQRELAAKIAGDTPEQAKAFLLHTGVLNYARVTQNIPKDPEHVRFVVFIGL